jgi:hypothetical protein
MVGFLWVSRPAECAVYFRHAGVLRLIEIRWKLL